jgi:hypothetical protein
MANKTIDSPDHVSVGIVSIGMYLLEPTMTAVDLAERSGRPEWVVREKAAGIGWARGATCVKWGPRETRTVTHQMSCEHLHSRCFEDCR